MRIVFCLRKYDHISSFRRQLNWFPICELTSLFPFCSTRLHLITLDEHFNFKLYDRDANFNVPVALCSPCLLTVLVFWLISSLFTQLSNALAHHVIEAQTELSFKRILRKHLLDNLYDQDSTYCSEFLYTIILLCISMFIIYVHTYIHT